MKLSNSQTKHNQNHAKCFIVKLQNTMEKKMLFKIVREIIFKLKRKSNKNYNGSLITINDCCNEMKNKLSKQK